MQLRFVATDATAASTRYRAVSNGRLRRMCVIGWQPAFGTKAAHAMMVHRVGGDAFGGEQIHIIGR
jgi:hypothetical protein